MPPHPTNIDAAKTLLTSSVVNLFTFINPPCFAEQNVISLCEI